MNVKRTELGCPGHFIAANSCRWRRHTQVGRYRVSSIGDYFPITSPGRETVGGGAKDFFETMVFDTTGKPADGNEGCGCLEVKDYLELYTARYATAGEAQIGHEKAVAKFLRKQSKR